MDRGKRIIFLFTLVLGAICALCLKLDPQPQASVEGLAVSDMCTMEVRADGRTEEISLWQGPNGEYTVFLPGYAQMDQVAFRIQPECEISLGAEPVTDGMHCGNLRLGEHYVLRGTDKQGNTLECTLSFQRGSALPAVYVDVRSGNMTYIHANKENEEPGTMRIYLPDGTLDYAGDLESIKGRGNATWSWDKKPYNLKLRREGDLLNMGQAQSWVLLANTYDPSHLRNQTVYQAADALGLAYTPKCRFVDLYLNGEYAGVYLLAEKNEIHPQRVDISETTGNLISIEKKERLWEYGTDQFITDCGTPIRIRATQDPEALQDKLNAAERAILSEEGIDPVTGKSWQDLIDLESWAKKVLLEEVFGNLDAGYISQFFYWDDSQSGKIYAGPAWDYDVTMGREGSWQLRDPNMLYALRPHLEDWEDSPWYYALYQKPEFREYVIYLYETQLRPILEGYLCSDIPAWTSQIRDSAAMDRLRWNGVDPEAAAAQLTDFMQRRIAFLDSYWLEDEPYYTVQMYIHWHVMACYAIPAGECIPEMEVPEGTETIRYIGWYDADTQQAVDFSEPVTSDRRIYLLEETAQGTVKTTFQGGLSGKIKYIPITAMSGLLLLVLIAEIRNRKRDHTRGENSSKHILTKQNGG